MLYKSRRNIKDLGEFQHPPSPPGSPQKSDEPLLLLGYPVRMSDQAPKTAPKPLAEGSSEHKVTSPTSFGG